MIELKQVTAGYGRKKVAENVSFSAGDGQITVLLGRNGCGKTTLLRAIAGNLPYCGSIRVQGLETGRLKPRQRARLLAVMPQVLRSPEITVEELVSYGRQPYTGLSGILSDRDRQLVAEALAASDLQALANMRLDRISGGERQRAWFAMLLAQDAPNLLLDEPGAFLDAAAMKRLCAFLLRERAAGKAVLAVLHDVNTALELADRLVVLGEENAFVGTPREFMEQQIAQRYFGLRRYACIDDRGDDVILYR